MYNMKLMTSFLTSADLKFKKKKKFELVAFSKVLSIITIFYEIKTKVLKMVNSLWIVWIFVFNAT